MSEPLTGEHAEHHILQNGKKPQIVSGLNRPLQFKPLGEQSRAVRRQELMVILGNIGLLATGMAYGLPTVTMSSLTDPNGSLHLTESQASWFASINTLSCPLGGLLSGILLDKFGRKVALYIVNISALISWTLMALAIQDDPQTVYIQLLVSRFLFGITTGLSSAPAGVYSAEISLPKIRGRLILGTAISTSAGITLIYILGYFIRTDWHLIAMICCCYQLIAIFCIIPMPESPSWLVSKGRFIEAKESLNYFRGQGKTSLITHPEVEAEFHQLQKSTQLGIGEKKPSFFKLLRLPEVYKPLLILMGLFTFQQVTGIFVVIAYAVQIFVAAGVTIDPFLCAIMVGFARLVTTCSMGTILEKWGRRRAGIISAFGMFVCMFLLAGHSWWPWFHKIPYVPVVTIVSFILLSTFGLYTLPFFMISELFPQKVRGPASGLTVAVGMFMAFVAIKTYPHMRDTIGNEYCYIFYGIMSFIAMIFVYLVLPETRGRTLAEIEQQFRGGRTWTAEADMQKMFLK